MIGVLTAVLVVAGLAVVVARGGQSAQVIGASANGFATVIGAATHPGS